MTGPSDFENGVLAAARWLKSKGHADLAGKLIREIPTDLDGTEDRVCKQIAAWLACAPLTADGKLSYVRLAQDVLERCWRQP